MKDHYLEIIKQIGEDPSREGLVDTPDRAAKAMRFLTKGYHEDLSTVINDAIFSVEDNHMVIVKDIELYSLCEHHMLPFLGNATLAISPMAKCLV